MTNVKSRTHESSGWVMEEESDQGTRTCLAFRFGRHKKSHEKRGIGARNDQERPVYQSTSSFATSQTHLVSPASRSSSLESPLDRLLKPPTPEDRRKRAAYESQKRKNGLYDGEIEPEGHRGQEMTVPPPAAVVSPEESSPSLPIRNFSSQSNTPSRQFQQPMNILLRDDPPSVGSEQARPNEDLKQSLTPPTHDDDSPFQILRADDSKQRIAGQLDFSRTDEQRTPREPSGTAPPPDAPLLLRPPRPPSINSNRPPQFTPSLQASKASSPANAAAAILLGDDCGDSSSSSSSSLKKLQEDFLNELELLPSDEEDDRGQGEENSRLPNNQGVNSSQRSFFPSSTPNTPTTAATSSTQSIASSSANFVGTGNTGTAATAAERNVHALHSLAMEHVHNGELESAVSILETVVTLQTRIHGRVSPPVASAYHNLGTVHAKRAQMMTDGSVAQAHLRAMALQCFQTAARTARDSLGRYHGNVAVSLVRMGFLLLQARHYQNAVIVFQEALRIRLSVYGNRHLLVANLYNNLGVCHMHLGEFAKGREYLHSALDIQRDLTSGSIHQLELADTLFNIGGLCVEWIRRQGPDARRAVEAEEAFAEAYEIRKSILGPGDSMTVQVRALLEMARAVPRPKVTSSSRHKLPRSPDRSASLSPNRDKLPPRSPDRSASSAPKRAAFHEPISVRTTRSDEQEPDNDNEAEETIFRSSSSFPPRNQSRNTTPPEQKTPLTYVSVSQDENEHDDSTRVFLLAQHVPLSSPSAHSSSNDAVNFSLESSFSPDFSVGDAHNKARSAASIQKVLSYDAEENCLISETGVESERGKIHYPLSWNRAGLDGSGAAGSPSRDIMVTRPFRRREMATNSDNGAALSNKRGREPVNFSTGNKERDDVMTRAKAVIDAHSDLPDFQDPYSSPRAVSSSDCDDFDDRQDQDARVMRSLARNLVQADGVAPLGGEWPREKNAGMSIREMLADPMNHLHLIHEEATRRLHENDYLDALTLFETVLECQRRRHGQLHPDVASALHNVGIVHLHAQNHAEALKAFEEGARIRKGSLGREHPQVAESLVKVGITLLLLHRFEDALWSFREALSIRKHAMGSLHPSTARIYNNIGCVHVEFNEYRDARRAFEAALDIQRNALAQDPESGPLLFATATTLCNLGYLYRFRDMHSKAALVLKEAYDLQERVLGRAHPTVLSTIDNLADAYANSGQAVEALKYYHIVLDRFQGGNHRGSSSALRAQAVLLYKMSRVYKQRNDREAQLSQLKLALRAIREIPESTEGRHTDTLERRIQYDIRICREQLEKEELEWI